VSPDGANLYVADSFEGKVAVFSRESATGALAFLEFQQNGRVVDGLKGARAVTVSPDGAYVYAVGEDDDAVAVFRRNAATGALSFLEVRAEARRLRG